MFRGASTCRTLLWLPPHTSTTRILSTVFPTHVQEVLLRTSSWEASQHSRKRKSCFGFLDIALIILMIDSNWVICDELEIVWFQNNWIQRCWNSLAFFLPISSLWLSLTEFRLWFEIFWVVPRSNKRIFNFMNNLSNNKSFITVNNYISPTSTWVLIPNKFDTIVWDWHNNIGFQNSDSQRNELLKKWTQLFSGTDFNDCFLFYASTQKMRPLLPLVLSPLVKPLGDHCRNILKDVSKKNVAFILMPVKI